MTGCMRTIVAAASIAAAGCAVERDSRELRGGASGRFELTWNLVVAGEQVRCTDLGAAAIDVRADTVGLIATDRASGEVFSDQFACAAMGGVTRDIPVGDYAVRIFALRANDSVATSDPATASIRHHDQLVYLGDFTFTFGQSAGDEPL